MTGAPSRRPATNGGGDGDGRREAKEDSRGAPSVFVVLDRQRPPGRPTRRACSAQLSLAQLSSAQPSSALRQISQDLPVRPMGPQGRHGAASTAVADREYGTG
jgi:hypothetical protein